MAGRPPLVAAEVLTAERTHAARRSGVWDDGSGSATRTYVPPSAYGCRLRIPDLPAGGDQTITLAEYRAWEQES